MIKANGIVGRQEIAKVDPRAIVIDEENNYRHEYGDITSLKQSIQENGLLVPIRCRKNDDNNLELIEGYRRMRAIKAAIDEDKTAFKWIPCIIASKGINEAEILLTNLAANDGLKPTPLEECEAYQRLIHYGWHKKDIAKRVGRSTTHITNILKLRNASPELKENLKNKKVGTVKAIKITEESNGSIEKQSKAINEHKEEKAAKKKAKQIEKATVNPMGLVTPPIPGMQPKPSKPKPSKSKPSKSKPSKSKPSKNDCDLGDWVIDAIKDEWKNLNGNQDTILLKSQIDDLVDFLYSLREQLGETDEND